MGAKVPPSHSMQRFRGPVLSARAQHWPLASSIQLIRGLLCLAAHPWGLALNLAARLHSSSDTPALVEKTAQIRRKQH